MFSILRSTQWPVHWDSSKDSTLAYCTLCLQPPSAGRHTNSPNSFCRNSHVRTTNPRLNCPAPICPRTFWRLPPTKCGWKRSWVALPTSCRQPAPAPRNLRKMANSSDHGRKTMPSERAEVVMPHRLRRRHHRRARRVPCCRASFLLCLAPESTRRRSVSTPCTRIRARR